MLADNRDGLSSSSFCTILDSSIGLSVDIQSAGELVSETLGSNPAFSTGRQLFDSHFDSNIACLCQSIKINNTHTHTHTHIYIYIYISLHLFIPLPCKNWSCNKIRKNPGYHRSSWAISILVIKLPLSTAAKTFYCNDSKSYGVWNDW